MRGATHNRRHCQRWSEISIHAPRAGGDHVPFSCCFRCTYFNPRPPCGGRPSKARRGQRATRISIHAPRAGGDVNIPQQMIYATGDFNPRPPCGGRRRSARRQSPATDFNPRPPCGGRRRSARRQSPATDFNPRPPCGGRLYRGGVCCPLIFISIHAPRAGGDAVHFRSFSKIEISIHAPRAGGDPGPVGPQGPEGKFQSTPPVRGATLQRNAQTAGSSISIHAPRAGGDPGLHKSFIRAYNFNPRPPCGGRRNHVRLLRYK